MADMSPTDPLYDRRHWKPPEGYFIIKTTEQLRNLSDEDRSKIISPDTTHLWLADLGDDLVHTGSWSAPHWTEAKVDILPEDEAMLKLWRDLFDLLLDRKIPLTELAIHSSALLHFAKVDVLWSADGTYFDDGKGRSSTGFIKSGAPHLKVKRLKTWGNVIEEVLLDRISDIETFSILGCRHAFEYRNFGRLMDNLSPKCRRINLVGRGDVTLADVASWLENLAWVQRVRSLYGDRQPWRFIHLFLPGRLVSDHGKWIRDMWDNKMGEKYTGSARLIITVHQDPQPDLLQPDHDRLEFGMETAGTYRHAPPRGSLCFCETPDLLTGDPEAVSRDDLNAHGYTTTEAWCLSPGTMAQLGQYEPGWPDYGAEIQTESRLSEMLSQKPLIQWQRLQDERRHCENFKKQATLLLTHIKNGTLSSSHENSWRRMPKSERYDHMQRVIAGKVRWLKEVDYRIAELEKKNHELREQSRLLGESVSSTSAKFKVLSITSKRIVNFGPASKDGDTSAETSLDASDSSADTSVESVGSGELDGPEWANLSGNVLPPKVKPQAQPQPSGLRRARMA